MWGKIMIPMFRLWLHGLYGLYGSCCPLSPERPLNLITHSLTCRVLYFAQKAFARCAKLNRVITGTFVYPCGWFRYLPIRLRMHLLEWRVHEGMPNSGIASFITGNIFYMFMMTSSNGNIFHVTGHLCREFTGHRWIPSTRASDAELWCCLWFAPE